MDTDAAGLSRRDFVSAVATIAAGSTLGVRAQADTRADAIVNLGALDLSAAIKQRRVSCVEVMQSYLAHIGRVNPLCNALVSLQPEEQLLAQAAERDAQLASGIYHGWMHGIPHAVKDLADVSGIVTSNGSPIFRNNVATRDSIFVERIRKAGAIFIGKTNVPEFGLGSQCYNNVFGTTLNAWDQSRTSGGSSGGAAVGLALRMLPVADGSDMMGSLRNPAGWNNVYGFRPSYGRVPGDGAEYLQQLGYDGAMGRSVAELARLLATMAGFDARDPLSIAEDPARFAAPLDSEVRGLRVGWLGDYAGYLPMEPGVLDLCKSSLASFEALGCEVGEARVDFDMPRLWQTWLTHRHWLIASGSVELYENPAWRRQLKPELIWEIENGLPLSGLQVAGASRARAEWYAALCAAFERHDFLVLPSAQVFPFDAGVHWPTEIAGRPMDTYHRWMEVVIGGTLSGCPVINVPAGFNAQGLPMGVQIIAPMHQDFRLLQLAAAYEKACGWTDGKHQPALLRT